MRVRGIPAGVHLPTDLPPGERAHLGPTNVAGLITHASLGQAFYPLYTRPWTPYGSKTFPKVKPSDVAPNGFRPTWVVAINAYSPIAHRSGLTAFTPPAATPARGVGRVTQRGRPFALGFTTRWPQISPRWPSFGEAPGGGSG